MGSSTATVLNSSICTSRNTHAPRIFTFTNCAHVKKLFFHPHAPRKLAIEEIFVLHSFFSFTQVPLYVVYSLIIIVIITIINLMCIYR